MDTLDNKPPPTTSESSTTATNSVQQELNTLSSRINPLLHELKASAISGSIVGLGIAAVYVNQAPLFKYAIVNIVWKGVICAYFVTTTTTNAIVWNCISILDRVVEYGNSFIQSVLDRFLSKFVSSKDSNNASLSEHQVKDALEMEISSIEQQDAQQQPHKGLGSRFFRFALKAVLFFTQQKVLRQLVDNVGKDGTTNISRQDVANAIKKTSADALTGAVEKYLVLSKVVVAVEAVTLIAVPFLLLHRS